MAEILRYRAYKWLWRLYNAIKMKAVYNAISWLSSIIKRHRRWPSCAVGASPIAIKNSSAWPALARRAPGVMGAMPCARENVVTRLTRRVNGDVASNS